VTNHNERVLRLIEIGVDHPHAVMYRQTILHHPGIDLVGAIDADPERATATLATEGFHIPVHRTLDHLLTQVQADAVLVTLPNDLTAAAISDAAAHNLHVFAEKPGARTANEFQPALEAVESRDLVFGMAYLRRFSLIATRMQQIVADGLIGDLVSAQITFSTLNVAQRNAAYLRGSRPELLMSGDDTAKPAAKQTERNWLFDRERAGGGIMHWLGVHWLDLLRYVSGDDVTHVQASLATRTEVPIDVEDTALLILEFAGGMQASVSCAYVLDRGPDQIGIAFQGTKGWLHWPGSGPELTVFSSHPTQQQAPKQMFRIEPDPMPGYSGALGFETLDRFRRAVLFGEPMPVTPTDALRVLEILDAAHLSAKDHRRVAIHPA
jgi:predicted dehydrogenase